MHLLLALAASLAQPAAAPPPSAEPSQFGALFTDWRSASGEAIEQERARGAANAPARTEADSRALGDRVGQIVAEGACEEGERIAREAGDFALVRAVQDHCRRVPVSELPGWARPQR